MTGSRSAALHESATWRNGGRWRKALLPAMVLAVLLVFYLFMFLRYRPYELDNPWFLSFSYNSWGDRIFDDRFMMVRFPAGMDGTQLFGRMAAALQGLVLSQVGWQQWPAAVLSSTFVVLALGLWWLQLRRLGYSASYRVLFLVAVGLSEPCLSTADKFRYEFLSFFLISLGLLLVAYGRPVFGLFVAALAVEVQPAALAGIVAVVVLTCCLTTVTRRLILTQSAALAAALLVYLSLHPHIFTLLRTMPHTGGKGFALGGGFFASYFLDRLRHVPELLCFLLAGALYWQRRQRSSSDARRREHALALVALTLTIFSILMPHGNTAYMVFVYPSLVVLALTAFRAEAYPRLTVAAIMLYTIPQYLFLCHLSLGQGFRTADIQSVSHAVDAAARQLHLDDRELNIYGDYRLWFAHPHRYRAAAESTIPEIPNADLYLCFDRAVESSYLAPQKMMYCPQLLNLVPLRLFAVVPVRNQLLHLYVRQ